MISIRWFLSAPLLLLCFFLISGTTARGASAPTPSRTVSLPEALELAHKNNLSLLANQSKIEKANTLLDQANAARFPKLMGTGIAAPLYKVTGDANQSSNDIKTWGAWLQANVTVLQPIYTWGKLSSLKEAALRNIDVQTADLRNDRNQVDYDVKEVYYGSVLVEQLYNFLDDGKKDLDEIQKKIDEDQERKHPKILRRDGYRFKVFAAEAEYRWQEIQKLRQLAHHGLSLRLGFDPEQETIPQETALVAIDSEPPSEEELVKLLKAHRPELEMIDTGIKAKSALLESEKANKMPMVFVGGMLTFAYSNVRSPQNSAFAFDPYNRSSGGIGVGMQWNFDFKTTLANQGAIVAEITELERKQAYADQGFRMELKKALADLKEARQRLVTSKKAYDIGRKWLTTESMNYSIGLTEIKDLIDAYLARAKTAKDYWEASLRVNMAWASLSKVVGVELAPDLLTQKIN